MDLLLIFIVLAVATYAWLLHRKAKHLVRRLDQVNDRLYAWGAESRKSLDSLEGRLTALEFERRRSRGEIEVRPDMLISDVLAIHPRMKEVLAAMHLGGCSSCSTSKAETLGQGAASYGLDIEGILREIGVFLEAPEEYRAEPKPHGGPQGIVQIQVPTRTGA